MPPLFRSLRTAGRRLAGAGLAMLVAWIGVSPIVAGGRQASAAADVRASAVGTVVLPESHAALPGLSATGAGLAEIVRESGRHDGTGSGRRSRERAGTTGASGSDSAAGAVRARATERERLGHTATLHRAVAGYNSFHCDTPPPAQA